MAKKALKSAAVQYGKTPTQLKEYETINIYGQAIVGVMVRQYEKTCVIRDEKGENHLVMLTDVGIEPKTFKRYKPDDQYYEEYVIKARGPIQTKPVRKAKMW